MKPMKMTSQQRCFCVMLILGLLAGGQAESGPFRWVLRDPASDGKIIKENTTAGSPTFTITIGDVFPVVGGSQSKPLWGTYWCPSWNPGKSYCHRPGYRFCGYRGCETIVTSDRWKPAREDEFLRVDWGPDNCVRPKFGSDGTVDEEGTCTHLKLEILQPTDADWAVGKTWSAFIHKAGTDIGAIIQIIRLLPQAIGANKDIGESRPGSETTASPDDKNEMIKNDVNGKNEMVKKDMNDKNYTIKNEMIKNYMNDKNDTMKNDMIKNDMNDKNEMIKNDPSSSSVPPNLSKTHQTGFLSKPQAAPDDLFLRVLDAAFLPLNRSNPDLTSSCWLCCDAKPPFYEGVALDVPFDFSTADDPPRCRLEMPWKGITLNQVTGRGVCIGNAKLAKQNGDNCAKIVKVNEEGDEKWAIPSESAVWVCRGSGARPCVSLRSFDDAFDFCVQVLIVPRVLYHPEKEAHAVMEKSSRLQKRDAAAGVTLGQLLASDAPSLQKLAQKLSQLRTSVDDDVRRLQESLSLLEESPSSLSEVGLERRGCCGASRKGCCFYADHTGVVRASMAELRERLAQREKEREAQKDWFESWFNSSAGLAALIPTLIVLVALVAVALIFGPRVLKKFSSSARSQPQKVDVAEPQKLL